MIGSLSSSVGASSSPSLSSLYTILSSLQETFKGHKPMTIFTIRAQMTITANIELEADDLHEAQEKFYQGAEWDLDEVETIEDWKMLHISDIQPEDDDEVVDAIADAVAHENAAIAAQITAPDPIIIMDVTDDYQPTVAGVL